MYCSTLGYTYNPFLVKYKKAFLGKLRILWANQIDGDIPSDDFLLFPDNHALLLASIRPDIQEKESYLERLKKDFLLYKKSNNTLMLNKDECILGTNIFLTLDFQNPDAHKSTHPDHKKNQVNITFGDIPSNEWRNLFQKSFSIVQSVSPGFMDEINLMIRKIIPFDVSYRVHNSGSYRDAIGHLLMSYPTGVDFPELTLLEAILHEYNHNKLNLILQTEKLLLNDYIEKYYSPYRPDARPLHGVYLGVHAIVGAYWVILSAHVSGVLTLNDHWREKAIVSVLKNGLALQVLDKYALFSPLGKEILEEIRSVHRECLTFLKKMDISHDVFIHTKQTLKEHHMNVEEKYPGLLS